MLIKKQNRKAKLLKCQIVFFFTDQKLEEEHLIKNDMGTSVEQSLYERLGGIEGITPIVDEIVENHMTSPAVNKRFLP